MSIDTAGLYVHVPFCRARCPYCDFYSTTRLDRIDDYVQALLVELGMYRQAVATLDSIYLGGGTPSLLAPDQVARIIDAVAVDYTLAGDVEVTLEVNPGTVTRRTLAAYRRAGINRLNIGLQSLENDALRFLGRIHTAAEGLCTYGWAREVGFENLGLDLIYARPGQTLPGWQAELAAAVDLQPEHFSCYTLTLEKGTPMADSVRNGSTHPLNERTAARLFETTIDHLETNGYRQYEISNFARHGADDPMDRRSRHNRKYWMGAPYLGVGAAAHSFRDGTRWWNHRSLDRYMADVSTGLLPVSGRERLTRDQQIMEWVYLGLRQTDGIDLADFSTRFSEEFLSMYGAQVSALIEGGLLAHVSTRIRLTRRGMPLLEPVVDRILG